MSTVRTREHREYREYPEYREYRDSGWLVQPSTGCGPALSKSLWATGAPATAAYRGPIDEYSYNDYKDESPVATETAHPVATVGSPARPLPPAIAMLRASARTTNKRARRPAAPNTCTTRTRSRIHTDTHTHAHTHTRARAGTVLTVVSRGQARRRRRRAAAKNSDRGGTSRRRLPTIIHVYPIRCRDCLEALGGGVCFGTQLRLSASWF